jgi:uncharacterized membrane protein (UPF0127 family)
MKRPYILLGVVGLLVLLTFLHFLQRTESFQSTSLLKGTFLHENNVILTVDLELANTPIQIEQGLMHRTYLAPNQGMLFWFETEAMRRFWMRNTLIPLDMIFVTSAGRITNIIPSATPKTEELRFSSEPVQYVVELPGGTAEKYRIQAGDTFKWNN